MSAISGVWWRDGRPVVRKEVERLAGPGIGRIDALAVWVDGSVGLGEGEDRQPFFDRRLMRFILELPPEAFYARGVYKLILRRALADLDLLEADSVAWAV